jgi:hypothetical protein
MIDAWPSTPDFKTTVRIPLGVRFGSRYLKPGPVSRQHGRFTHTPPAGATAVIARWGNVAAES